MVDKPIVQIRYSKTGMDAELNGTSNDLWRSFIALIQAVYQDFLSQCGDAALAERTAKRLFADGLNSVIKHLSPKGDGRNDKVR